ncbi:CARDB domain-containing protein [Dethiothermospora halolimnae]|uniref:CARDB domain-containing protein n=1 Tax=Dethiothermospora halolimnae TaxID=3114390 RepID=UPI003CCBD31A
MRKMSYLELDNPTTKSCEFEVGFSKPFNRKYYKRFRITGTYYGESTDNVRRYVFDERAGNSSSRYFRDEINDGMSAGRTYELYFYAQAQNGKWYLGGSDEITMKTKNYSNNGYLTIENIYTRPRYSRSSPFVVGEEVDFDVKVENNSEHESDKYYVRVRSRDVSVEDIGRENPLRGHDEQSQSLSLTVDEPGRHELIFEVLDRDEETVIDSKTETYTWQDKSRDLKITGIKHKGDLTTGKDEEFFVDVKNYSRSLESSNFAVYAYCDGKEVGGAPYERSLESGESRTVALDIRIDEPGRYRIHFVIDIDGGIVDIDYDDFEWDYGGNRDYNLSASQYGRNQLKLKVSFKVEQDIYPAAPLQMLVYYPGDMVHSSPTFTKTYTSLRKGERVTEYIDVDRFAEHRVKLSTLGGRIYDSVDVMVGITGTLESTKHKFTKADVDAAALNEIIGNVTIAGILGITGTVFISKAAGGVLFLTGPFISGLTRRARGLDIHMSSEMPKKDYSIQTFYSHSENYLKVKVKIWNPKGDLIDVEERKVELLTFKSYEDNLNY